MKTPLIAVAFGGLTWGLLQTTAHAGPIPQAERQPATQLLGLTSEEAQSLIEKTREAQSMLRSGKATYFQLLSGAPASYEMNTTSPRDAFLAADFTKPFSVERLPPDNSSWKPFRLILMPNGTGSTLWEVEVVLGFYEQIERVEMYYRPPHPF